VLRFDDNGKRRWREVGADPNQALVAKLHQEHILTGRKLGKPVLSDPALEEAAGKPERPLKEAIDLYLSRLARRSKEGSVHHFESALRFFAQSVTGRNLSFLSDSFPSH
jgi:hypothetical protein